MDATTWLLIGPLLALMFVVPVVIRIWEIVSGRIQRKRRRLIDEGLEDESKNWTSRKDREWREKW